MHTSVGETLLFKIRFLRKPQMVRDLPGVTKLVDGRAVIFK